MMKITIQNKVTCVRNVFRRDFKGVRGLGKYEKPNSKIMCNDPNYNIYLLGFYNNVQHTTPAILRTSIWKRKNLTESSLMGIKRRNLK